MASAQTDNRKLIGVLGLWHLGSVTSACLAEAGGDVLGVDTDAHVVEELNHARPPVFEPGLAELIVRVRRCGRLRFSVEPSALADVRQAWVAFDTPVDEDDCADVESVLSNAAPLLARLRPDTLVVVSSQLPVGGVARLQARCAALRGDDDLRFACVPENLRLGSALDCFRAPDRIVAGVRSDEDRRELAELLAPFGTDVQWMRVESAEMTKHALNGFLATSVAFMNEVAAVCELVGADAAEVARGLKSERRIGPGAYLEPGDAFAGGTLARDIGFLCDLAERHDLPAHVARGVAAGNAAHKRWTQRALLELLGVGDPADGQDLAGRVVAIWGLTYKPGTDTLRRSRAVELCRWLHGLGASVQAHDPAVGTLAPDLDRKIVLCPTPLRAAAGADALVVCTAWSEYREVPVGDVLSALSTPAVIDPSGWLCDRMVSHPEAHYMRVGAPARKSTDSAERQTALVQHELSPHHEPAPVTSASLADRTALITGGTRGLGLEIARAYLQAGARGVCVCGRDAHALDAATAELSELAGTGQQVLGVLADVSACADVERLLSSALACLGELTILVSNAGVYGPKGGIDRTAWSEWVRAIEINLFGSVLSARAVTPHFVRRGYGKIVQLSGGGATGPLPGLSAYAASKTAAVRFAETLACELREHHVDVNAIAPGALNTRMLDEVLVAGPERVGEDFHRRALQQRRSGGVPLRRAAELAVFLGSAASDGITGRLLSAVWDPWLQLPARVADLDSDVYTLRRIVPADRGLAWGAV